MPILPCAILVALLATDPPLVVDQKLAMAFGKDCKEFTYPLRLWFSERQMALAAGEFAIESDGRIKLAPCSVAVFAKQKGQSDDKSRALTTIRSDCVYLTLDRPAANISEFVNRKIIAIEASGLPKVSVGDR